MAAVQPSHESPADVLEIEAPAFEQAQRMRPIVRPGSRPHTEVCPIEAGRRLHLDLRWWRESIGWRELMGDAQGVAHELPEHPGS